MPSDPEPYVEPRAARTPPGPEKVLLILFLVVVAAAVVAGLAIFGRVG